jgi:hypothetical protein
MAFGVRFAAVVVSRVSWYDVAASSFSSLFALLELAFARRRMVTGTWNSVIVLLQPDCEL